MGKGEAVGVLGQGAGMLGEGTDLRCVWLLGYRQLHWRGCMAAGGVKRLLGGGHLTLLFGHQPDPRDTEKLRGKQWAVHC